MLDRPLKEEDFSPEEMKKCKEDPLYFYNKYVKHEGKRDLTQEEYNAVVKARNSHFVLKSRDGENVFAYPKIPGSCNGYRPGTPIFDDAGDPRLMSEQQKQEMLRVWFEASGPIKSTYSLALQAVIERLRILERDKQENEKGPGGIKILDDMLKEGTISNVTHGRILPAIKNYNDPFELIFD